MTSKALAVGLNHIALGDIEEALAFYGRLFEFTLRGKSEHAAFIDLGDQFLALQKGRKQPGDDARHFGLVVDNKRGCPGGTDRCWRAGSAGALPRLLDPWGNRIEIVGYETSSIRKCHTSCAGWA
jgi:lactoylglutathione lyase